MKLGDKLRSLRAVEGSLRGLGRTMTQQELAAAMKNEIGRGQGTVTSGTIIGQNPAGIANSSLGSWNYASSGSKP